MPGRPVPDQILESVETSRRTVIVLSSHYVQSMWSNLEFRAAHSKAIEENIQVMLLGIDTYKPISLKSRVCIKRSIY